MVEVLVRSSIREIGAAAWNRCFPGEIENAAYYLAIENARLPGFEWRYFVVADAGNIIAAVPAFITDYRLDTTLEGPLSQVVAAIGSRVPRLVSIPLICLGSPVSEICHLGFAPDVPVGDRPALLARLVGALEAHSQHEHIPLIGIKDAPAVDAGLWRRGLVPRGYTRLRGLPTAVLPLPFSSRDDYLASLSRATRKDVRRKLRGAAMVTVDRRRRIDDVIDRIGALYAETRARSDLKFEDLPAMYFSEVLEQSGENASCFLYWVGGTLVAFNLVLHDDRRLVDKFFGMDTALGRDYNLYVLSWMTNVERAIAEGIPLYQSGQAGYGPKLRLGSQLLANDLYFRHRGRAVNAMLRLAGRLAHFDPEGAGDRRVKATHRR